MFKVIDVIKVIAAMALVIGLGLIVIHLLGFTNTIVDFFYRVGHKIKKAWQAKMMRLGIILVIVSVILLVTLHFLI